MAGQDAHLKRLQRLPAFFIGARDAQAPADTLRERGNPPEVVRNELRDGVPAARGRAWLFGGVRAGGTLRAELGEARLQER